MGDPPFEFGAETFMKNLVIIGQENLEVHDLYPESYLNSVYMLQYELLFWENQVIF